MVFKDRTGTRFSKTQEVLFHPNNAKSNASPKLSAVASTRMSFTMGGGEKKCIASYFVR